MVYPGQFENVERMESISSCITNIEYRYIRPGGNPNEPCPTLHQTLIKTPINGSQKTVSAEDKAEIKHWKLEKKILQEGEKEKIKNHISVTLQINVN